MEEYKERNSKEEIEAEEAVEETTEETAAEACEEPGEECTAEEKPEKGEKKKSKLKKGLLIALFVFLGLVAATVIAGFIYIESLLSLVNKADDEVLETMSDAEYQAMMDAMQETVPEDFTGPVLESEDINWGEEVEVIESDDDIINILLIGQDRREGEGRTRSDTLILCTINKPAKTLTLTSFMRDMYVQIPGHDDNRINVAYMFGGMRLIDSCLRTNFGVNVDANVVVDFYGFMGIVDMMGGVDMELTEAEANYMNANFSWDVEDGLDDEWNLTAGMNHLNGSQALSYARMRKVGNSDFQRTERQRAVISALVEKAKSLSAAELNLLLQHALPMITTDLEDEEIVAYALELIPMLPELEVGTLRIPVDGSYESAMVNGMAVLIPDLGRNQSWLWKIMKTPD